MDNIAPATPRSRLTPYLWGLSLLLIPLIGTSVSGEVNWSPLDFIVGAAIILLAVGLFDLVGRRVDTTGKRLPYYAIIAIFILYLWAELAVGIFFNFGS
ncbi:hypothetical protein [Sphingomicrobium sediminis]|uniref:Uncharacterized protein n=1 Tax=Sphingomicrobium sediminis TaxID=2950949 RepID=A0A9X2EN83_9SPHN|nr:hypothetical protein [Sphingomicrobium sediminis]MCM8558287.1 hypothetical protein [Sphingomicrobium sediminis]